MPPVLLRRVVSVLVFLWGSSVSAALAAPPGPRVPEPLQFDLVRGLESEAGELEVNALVNVSAPPGESPVVRWAPEIEVTLLRGFSLELELPFAELELLGGKGAAQLTLPGSTAAFSHGLQGIGEYRLATSDVESSALYLVGLRSGAASLLAMAGARLTPREEQGFTTSALVNASVFFDASRSLTWGLETNWVFRAEGPLKLRILPQIHLELTPHTKLQLGAGLTISSGEISPFAAARWVFD